MQETKHFNDQGELETQQEVFQAETNQEVQRLMDRRLKELEKQGHFLSQRKPLDQMTQAESKRLKKRCKNMSRREFKQFKKQIAE